MGFADFPEVSTCLKPLEDVGRCPRCSPCIPSNPSGKSFPLAISCKTSNSNPLSHARERSPKPELSPLAILYAGPRMTSAYYAKTLLRDLVPAMHVGQDWFLGESDDPLASPFALFLERFAPCAARNLRAFWLVRFGVPHGGIYRAYAGNTYIHTYIYIHRHRVL